MINRDIEPKKCSANTPEGMPEEAAQLGARELRIEDQNMNEKYTVTWHINNYLLLRGMNREGLNLEGLEE